MSTFNLKRLIVAVIFTAGVVYPTHLPDESIPDQFHSGRLDKIAHMVAYGTITFLFFLSLKNSISLLTTLLLFLAILGVGTIDEITQPIVHRTASLADWLADIAGIFVVCAFKAVQSFSNHRQVKATDQTTIFEN